MDDRATYLSTALDDIACRNAGKPTLTVWTDGSFVVQGSLDAEIDSRSDWGNAARVLLNIDIETMEAVHFLTREEMRTRTRLYEKVLLWKKP